jgi:hypothetical protein
MSTYITVHIGTNQWLGAIQGGFESDAYHAAAAGERAGENTTPTAPAARARAMNATKASQFGRAFRPR